MQFAIMVASGLEEGRTIPVRSGETVRFGRDAPAAEQFPYDTFMSRLHFEIQCADSGCILRDLGSGNGTVVENTRVSEISVPPGARFRAGHTDFVLLQVSDQEVANPPAVANAAESHSQLPEIALVEPYGSIVQTISAAGGGTLYAIVDATQDGAIPGLLGLSGEQYSSLYEGKQSQELAAVGPFLVRLSPQSRLLPILVTAG